MNDALGGRTKQNAPAKLTRPHTRGALPRERLFQLMERGRQDKIIWICGPAGSGKTTLAATYLESRGIPCLWYQVDEGDADIATFFYYMGLAARIAAPRVRKDLPLLTPEYLQGVPVFAKRYFEQLSARLTGKAQPRSSAGNGRSAIVFDNYQEVQDGSLLHDVINAGISATAEGVSVIVLSRGEPPPAYARLRSMSEISLLGWEDLRLTAEESNGAATLKASKNLDGETLSLLHKTTDGWAAGLVLLVESLGVKDFNFQLHGGFARDEIFAYFTAELFDRSSKETQAFLLETSLLPVMSAPMAEELTGNPRAGRIFSDLSRKSYFTNRHAFAGQVFQYHPLFREFLLARANETMIPERLLEMKRGAAKVLETNGYIEDAVGLFCEAGEWSEAIRVILTHAPGLISQGRWQTLQGWIESLPGLITENQPWLIYWLGVCRFPTSPAGSRECFAKAFEQFKSAGNAAGSFLALSGMLDSVNFRLDTFHELDRLIAMMFDLLQVYPQFPSPEIESRVIPAMLYALMLRQPHNPAFEHWESRSLELVRDIKDMDLALHILCGLTLYRVYSGELERVKLLLESFHERIEGGHSTPVARLAQRDLQAFYYWLIADSEKNRWAAEDGIALADSSGVHYMDVYMLGHGAAGALSIGEISRAEGYLERVLSSLRMAPTACGECFYQNLQAWKCLIEVHLARASMHADLAIESGIAMGAPLMMPYPYLIKAIVMHELKEDREASPYLSEFWKICGTAKVYQAEFMGFLVEAKIAFDGGDEVTGRDFLRKGMAIGREHGYANAFFWVDSTMASLCAKALDAGIETDYVRGLIRKRNLKPSVPVLLMESWPWPLKIHTLGQFEILRNGEVVRFSGKVQRKPLLLLKALIALGGKEVKEELLCDALWPDAEGDLAHRSFVTTLYRLRLLIDSDMALRLTEGRLTLDTQSCWVDAFALEQLLDEAETLREAGRASGADTAALRDGMTRADQLTRRIISMYRGHLLEAEVEQSWMLLPRERLRARYLRAIETLGGYWKAAGDLQRAIQCYDKALEVDDLAEEFYQHLITCYQRLGLQAKALSVYTRCRSVLEAGLGIEPSTQTRALVESVRSKR